MISKKNAKSKVQEALQNLRQRHTQSIRTSSGKENVPPNRHQPIVLSSDDEVIDLRDRKQEAKVLELLILKIQKQNQPSSKIVGSHKPNEPIAKPKATLYLPQDLFNFAMKLMKSEGFDKRVQQAQKVIVITCSLLAN